MATSDEKFKDLEDKIGHRIDYVFMQARNFTDTEFPEFLKMFKENEQLDVND